MKRFGIDLSSHNGGISFEALKNEGVEFAILRAGYTGYGDGVSKAKDTQFENFYNQCKAYNIGVGAYWFTIAKSYDEGIAEANWMYENCLKGKQFDYPIYIDVEDDTGGRNWLKNAGRNRITDGIVGFCQRMEELGYYVGIYANLDWFNNWIDQDRVASYDKWLAYWTSNHPNTYLASDMWQFGGEYNAIRSPYIAGQNVDQDYCYYDYPSIIKSLGFNGYPKQQPTPAPEPTPEPAKSLMVGTKVRTIGQGNGSSCGDSNAAMAGYEGTITRILPAEYPYLVSDDEGPLGWYKADALEII